MRELGYEEVLRTIVIDRDATARLFDLGRDVVDALEASGVIEYGADGLAPISGLARGVFTEAAFIAFQCAAKDDAARTMALALGGKVMDIVEALENRVADDVMADVIQHFTEIGEICDAAGPILTMPIGSQSPEREEVTNG